jgi:2-keto-4-pentenoate hydratase
VLEDTQRREAAEALWEAARTGKAIDALTDTYEGIDVDDAYRIQLMNVRRHTDAGAAVKGHKVGLSAVAMQQMLGVHEPDYGHLLGGMFRFEQEGIPTEEFLQPRAEIEVAFVLGSPLSGPGVSVADVIRSTDFVLPAIEIVDSRIADWKIKIQDTIADNASCGAVVLGSRPTPLRQVDPALIGAVLMKNGEIVETGCSGAVLGQPAIAVAWLANKVAQFGIELQAGDVVMPGACCRMVPVAAGDVIRAEFDGLGAVSARFS